MKLLKQRFSICYNRSHQRYGTLWVERFKSVLVEAKSGVMSTMAASIDLNPVRAGIVTDPHNYRFCGYGEAIGGGKIAQRGLVRLVQGRGKPNWAGAQSSYRQTLLGKGSVSQECGGRLDPEKLKEVTKRKGRLLQPEVLRCRIRFFTDGAVLGSREDVQQHLTAYHLVTGRGARTAPRPLPGITDWGDLTTLRGLRNRPLG